MKKSTALFYLIVLMSTAGIYSCKKDRVETVPLKEYKSTDDYMDSKKQEEQVFIIDNDTSTSPIVGNQGTTISGAGRNCLMFPNGDSVSLPFTVKLIELYKPKDMIYARVPTVSSDVILETEGEVRIRVYKGSTELVLRPGCSFPIKMPSATPKNYMKVFYGYDVAPTVNWTNDLSSLGVAGTTSPAFANDASYHLASIERLGWVNCGIERPGTSNSNLTFDSSTDVLTNVTIFVYFPDTKTVMQVFNIVSGSIPNGSNVKVIAIGVDGNNDLFSFSKTMTVNNNEIIEVTMTAITDAALTTLLTNL